MHLLNRSGLAAIAAATALVSTPALAEDAAPVTSDPAPIVADTPLPSEPAAAPAAESDTLAPAAATTATKAKSAARPARATAAPVTVAAKTPVRTAAPAVAPVASTAPTAPVETPADPAMVAPLPEPVAPPAPAPAQTATVDSDVLPIAGAAGLGILALAGAGFAMRRRRRSQDELVDETWTDPAMTARTPSPIVATAPLVTAAPAFSWGDTPRAAPTAVALASDERISRIEAAKRGPTADNPSHSLKKRLARAAFFDRREQMVAAGKGVPVDAMAGLPEAMDLDHIESQQQQVRRPALAMRMSFNRSFQPA